MFSATMPPLVETLTKKYLRRPATVIIGNAGQVVDTIEQRVEFLSEEPRKIKRVQDILSTGDFKPPIIIFVNRKTECEVLQKALGLMVNYLLIN